MGSKTGIEWTDATWNPVRGCSRVSEGCANCYAEKVAYRFSAPGQPYEGLARSVNGHASWTGKVIFAENHLLDPLKWKPVKLPCADPNCGEMERATGCYGPESRPRRIFVNSMSDLFHENVPDEWIDHIFAVMALCPQHVFQVLTKRPKRMRDYLRMMEDEKDMQRWVNAALDLEVGGILSSAEAWEWPLLNVWLGVSVENQAAADERIPLLLRTPAAVRFISAEPLLGPVDIREYLSPKILTGCQMGNASAQELCDIARAAGRHEGFQYLDWVICGGESGPGARPMHPDWARSLRDQCQAVGVSFFFKQWGEWTPSENVERNSGIIDTATWFDSHWTVERENLANDEGRIDDQPDLYRVGKKAAGALLDGREWHEFPALK